MSTSAPAFPPDSRNPMNTNRCKYETGNMAARVLLRRFFSALGRFIDGIPIRSRVLDCGCAEGYAMELIRKTRRDIIFMGIDTDLAALRYAKGRNPSATFVCADARFLPFREGAFYRVLALEMLEHVKGEPEDALREISRVSSKGLIASVPHEPYFSLANLLMGRRIRRFGRDPEHLHAWGKRSFLRLLGRHFAVKRAVPPFPWIIAEADKR